MLFRIYLLLTLTILILYGHGKSIKQQKVLLVALDGFRWDFLNKTKAPNLHNIVKTGVSVEYVLNVFPTTTLPNHQSIVTGLYTENHGLIDNSFFNPDNGKIFNGQLESEWWSQSTPIWVVNQKQGHKSGACFWPGHRVKYENMTAEYLPDKKYTGPYKRDKIMQMNDRLDLVVDWLKRDDVTFVALYAEQIDEAAHEYGADSNKTKNKNMLKYAIKTIDEMVKNLKEKLKEEKLSSTVNVILIG